MRAQKNPTGHKAQWGLVCGAMCYLQCSSITSYEENPPFEKDHREKHPNLSSMIYSSSLTLYLLFDSGIGVSNLKKEPIFKSLKLIGRFIVLLHS